MGWLNSSLGNWMGDQEEIEGTVNDLWLLNEAIVDVGTLWRIGDTRWCSHLEESLSYSFVHDNEGVLW